VAFQGYTHVIGRPPERSAVKNRRREVIYLLGMQNNAKTMHFPIASCGSYLEAVEMAKPWHEVGGWHRTVKRVSIPIHEVTS
jgi:hypothetical protein